MKPPITSPTARTVRTGVRNEVRKAAVVTASERTRTVVASSMRRSLKALERVAPSRRSMPSHASSAARYHRTPKTIERTHAGSSAPADAIRAAAKIGSVATPTSRAEPRARARANSPKPKIAIRPAVCDSVHDGTAMTPTIARATTNAAAVGSRPSRQTIRMPTAIDGSLERPDGGGG